MSGGLEIIKEYEKNSSLSIQKRKLLVNLAVQIMINKHGDHPQTDAKIECAEQIIETFPALKDPSSGKGYVCIVISFI